MIISKESALAYHSQGRPGKIEVVPTKPANSQRDLSLAYTPGVAVPVLEIDQNPDAAYAYTIKGNLVASQKRHDEQRPTSRHRPGIILALARDPALCQFTTHQIAADHL